MVDPTRLVESLLTLQLLLFHHELVCASLDVVLKRTFDGVGTSAVESASTTHAAVRLLSTLLEVLARLRSLSTIVKALATVVAAFDEDSAAALTARGMEVVLSHSDVLKAWSAAVVVCPDRQLPDVMDTLWNITIGAWRALPAAVWTSSAEDEDDVVALPSCLRFWALVQLLVAFTSAMQITDINAPSWGAKFSAAFVDTTSCVTEGVGALVTRLSSKKRKASPASPSQSAVLALAAAFCVLNDFQMRLDTCAGYGVAVTSTAAVSVLIDRVLGVLSHFWEVDGVHAATFRMQLRSLLLSDIQQLQQHVSKAAATSLKGRAAILLAPPVESAPLQEQGHFLRTTAASLHITVCAVEPADLARYCGWVLRTAAASDSPVAADCSRLLSEAQVAEYPVLAVAFLLAAYETCSSALRTLGSLSDARTADASTVGALGMVSLVSAIPPVAIPSAQVPGVLNALSTCYTASVSCVESTVRHSRKKTAAVTPLLLSCCGACRTSLVDWCVAWPDAMSRSVFGARKDADAAAPLLNDLVRFGDVLLAGHLDVEWSVVVRCCSVDVVERLAEVVMAPLLRRKQASDDVMAALLSAVGDSVANSVAVIRSLRRILVQVGKGVDNEQERTLSKCMVSFLKGACVRASSDDIAADLPPAELRDAVFRHLLRVELWCLFTALEMCPAFAAAALRGSADKFLGKCDVVSSFSVLAGPLCATEGVQSAPLLVEALTSAFQGISGVEGGAGPLLLAGLSTPALAQVITVMAAVYQAESTDSFAGLRSAVEALYLHATKEQRGVLIQSVITGLLQSARTSSSAVIAYLRIVQCAVHAAASHSVSDEDVLFTRCFEVLCTAVDACSSAGSVPAACSLLCDVAVAVCFRPRQFRLSHRQVCHLLEGCTSAVLSLKSAVTPHCVKSLSMFVYTVLRHRAPAVEDCLPVLVSVLTRLLVASVSDHTPSQQHWLYLSRVFEEFSRLPDASLRRYVAFILVEYLQAYVSGSAHADHRQFVLPSLMALMKMATSHELQVRKPRCPSLFEYITTGLCLMRSWLCVVWDLQLLHAMLSHNPAARIRLKDLHGLYQKEYKFSGKV